MNKKPDYIGIALLAFFSILISVIILFGNGCISTTGKIDPYQIDPKNIDLAQIRQWVEDVFKANEMPLPEDLDEVIPPDVPPVPVPPPATQGEITLKWSKGGVNGSNAKYDEVAVLRDVKWSTSKITYSVDILHWPLTGEKDTRSICCLFIKDADGIYQGGKWDWARSGKNQTRDFHNIQTGYGGHRMPIAGDEVAFCLITKDAKKMSSIATWIWPG